jgi:WD40 repeat protein
MYLLLAGIVVFAGAAWEEPAQSNLGTLKGHAKEVTSLAFSSNGKHLVSASGDGTIRL